MKKYQPERTDFLINTEWGIAKEDLSADEAQHRGLVLFKERWVSADERKELKRQRLTYRGIRVAAFLLVLAAGAEALLLLANISRKAPVGALVMLGILAFAYIAAAVGLYVFKRWAYYAAVVLLLLGMVQSLALRRLVFTAIAVLVVVFLIRKPVRRVFSRPDAVAGPS